MDYSVLTTNIIIAIVPTIILCLFVYKMDVVEKEPVVMLLRLFFLGVLITVPAAFVEKSLIAFTGITPSNYMNSLIMAFAVVALVEEIYKFLILYLGTWKNKNFDHKYDAIVYAVFVSLGFATLENILYVYESEIRVALLRGIFSVPAHAFYAVASGYFLGLAKCSKELGDNKKKNLYLLLSLIAPITLHGIFDFLLFTENDVLLGVFYCFVGILYMVSYLSIKSVSTTKMIEEIKEARGEEQNERNI